jgi:hypothetical protein
MAALPVMKLGGLFLKTLSKPFAKRLKNEGIKHPYLRETFAFTGESTHQLTARLTIWSAGFKVKNIKPLDREVAITRGADIFAECIVLGVASAVVFYDYNASKASSKAKDAEKLAELDEIDRVLCNRLTEIENRLVEVEEELRNSERERERLRKGYLSILTGGPARSMWPWQWNKKQEKENEDADNNNDAATGINNANNNAGKDAGG